MFDNGKKIYSIKGYRNKNKFTNLIKYVGTKSYKEIDIYNFITNQEF
jgi:thioredoxin-related protein